MDMPGMGLVKAENKVKNDNLTIETKVDFMKLNEIHDGMTGYLAVKINKGVWNPLLAGIKY